LGFADDVLFTACFAAAGFAAGLVSARSDDSRAGSGADRLGLSRVGAGASLPAATRGLRAGSLATDAALRRPNTFVRR
jgi:hypothetical protein